MKKKKEVKFWNDTIEELAKLRKPVVSKSFTCSECIWYSSAKGCKTCDNGSNFELAKVNVCYRPRVCTEILTI